MSSVKEIRTKVVGVTKLNDEGERIQSLLEEMELCSSQGDLLDLEHDLDNEYDENAIKVFYEGDHIGYIKRELAAEIVQDVDKGCVQAKLCEITGGSDVSYGCNIILCISDEPIPYTPRPRRVPNVPDSLVEAAKTAISTQKTVGIPDLQRKLKIGYTQAAALMDKLEELGCVSPYIGSQPRQVLIYKKKLIDRIFKPVLITCLVIIVVTYSAVFFIRQKEKKEEAWDRKAVATAMIALDQFAPETNYGPASVTGWTVSHNNDGTTTVWAPQAYGRIAVMFTDDGEAYIPYYISVDGVVKLGK